MELRAAARGGVLALFASIQVELILDRCDWCWVRISFPQLSYVCLK